MASPTQALAKVRMRIDGMGDWLAYCKIDGHWLVTSKACHRES